MINTQTLSQLLVSSPDIRMPTLRLRYIPEIVLTCFAMNALDLRRRNETASIKRKSVSWASCVARVKFDE